MPIPDAVAQRTERALTRQDVRDYIRLRIDLHKKQEEMKANADQYDDVIHAFFQWQSEFLQARGRSRESFEALEKRIMAAETAMEMVADSAEYRTRLRNNRKAIRMSEHYSDAEKEEALAQYARQDSIQQARHIEPTRRDWPAVRPYLDALEHLTSYVGLNRPDPPDLDALPPANE
jgi:beta-phosphoglucomutase-like phosphatase (HAD superfamily)